VGLPIGLSSICIGFRDEKPIDGSKRVARLPNIRPGDMRGYGVHGKYGTAYSGLMLLASTFLYLSQKSDKER
jgi:hypothetical protein